MHTYDGAQCHDPEYVAEQLSALQDNICGLEANMRMLERAIASLANDVSDLERKVK